MAPKEGGSGRRKSSMFRRSPLTGLTPLDTGNVVTNDEDGRDQKETKERRKLKSKRSSVFSLGSSSTLVLPKDGGIMSPVEKPSVANPRPRPTQKENSSRSSRSRPTSMFGSFGKKTGSYTEEGEAENLAGTPESPSEDGETPALDHGRSMNRTVILAGEVQTSSGILSGFLKKKKEYLVLTETHLVRFKSQARAWETFPSTRPSAPKRGNPSRHASTTSIGSLHDAQSISHGSGELENTIPLEQIVTAYKLEDGKPFFTTEVVYLDEEYNGVGSVRLMLHDPGEADLWHSSIGAAAQKARLLRAENPFPRRIIDYLAGTLEIAQDYDQEHCQIYRVIRRASMQKGAKPSADDTGSCVFYMVVGLNKLHLIPLPDFTEANQHLSTSKFKGESFGLVNLVSMNVQQTDDRFELAFRTPLQKARVLELSAPANIEIGITVFKALHFLKPLWLDYTFVVGTPKSLLHGLQLPDKDESDHGNFDRTLTAYCRAYNCNPANIRYGIHWDVDDSPQWRLYSPAETKNYTAYELLAIMRSLRYNETFRSISFNNISLQKLHGLVDKEGQEHVAWTTLKGESIQAYYDINPQNKSLLYQEIQAIALKSRRLRRMDFTNTLPGRRPKEIFDQGDTKDPGCELLAGLATAVRAGEATVDWITMNGIELGETDFDAFDPLEARARLKAVECSHCALNDRLINLLIRRLEKQFATLECIDISNNPGRLNIVAFPLSMGRFTRIRKLDISGTSWSSGENHLFSEKTMLGWRLEELCLSGIPINKATLECIAAYLLSDKSSSLYMLQMEQCGLTGADVAFLMRSMSRAAGVARELEFQVSANRFKDGGVDEIVKAIEQNHTPSKLVMRMIEFRKDSHFRQLLDALRCNTTIRELDISKASLVNDAEAGPETCEALRNVFAENKSLIELDISGEQARLDVARFGIGLNNALMGLKENNTLKVLRIEYQNLGLEGANTLSSVFEANKGLTHVYCEHNFITLQGFTTLVNAVAKNFVVLDFPDMASDRELALKQLDDLPKATRSASSSARNGRHVPSSVRRTFTHIGASSKPSKQEPTPQDIDAGKSLINEKWAKELARLHAFLERNQNIAAGVEGYGVDAEGMLSDETMRPTTAMSDKGILDHVMSNTTPRIELNDPVDAHVGKMNRLGLGENVDTESRDSILGEENEKLEMHSEDDSNSTPTKKKPGKYGRGTHEARSQSLLPKIEMTEEMLELDYELFPMDN